MVRNLRYALEAIVLLFGLALLRVLPLDAASAFGGWLGRTVGPFTRAHRTADNNIARALPELSLKQRQKVLRGMWDNLGRVIGEYPHLSRPIMVKRITIEGREHLEAIKKSGHGALYISGHFANWEIAPLTLSMCGLPLVLIYRAANNPVADWVIRSIRSHYNTFMYNKGRSGAQEILRALKENRVVGMLIDQKMNDGEPVPFFGRDAMTATAGTQIAIKRQVPLMMTRVVRTDGAHFHVTLSPPLRYSPDESPREAMVKINQEFEGWVREHPEQWFWVHNRWSDKGPK